MPSCSSERPSSRSDRSMPFDASPRIVPAFSSMPVPGMRLPAAAKTPFMPVRALGAPQTTCTGEPAPGSTRHTRSRSAFGCCRASKTPAITNGFSFSAGLESPSSSSPTLRQRFGDFLGRGVGVEMVLQPGEGEFHCRICELDLSRSVARQCDWRKESQAPLSVPRSAYSLPPQKCRESETLSRGG